MLELGVFKGNFARVLLQQCPSLEQYYMLDPWRHLEDWNKPANKSDEIFEQFLAETMEKTDFAREKRVILRGKTTEVIDRVPDGSLDFVYIDGDHSLKGISIDLIAMLPKIAQGGWIGGDDFCPSVWQHPAKFEPTLVFPFVVYFAEAIGATIYALPHSQFLLRTPVDKQFSFVDLTGGTYPRPELGAQLAPKKVLWQSISDLLPLRKKDLKKVQRLVRKATRFGRAHVSS